MMSTPQIPPRPARVHHQQLAPAGPPDIPRIPPRPAQRIPARSQSPNRDNFPRSPLNEIPLAMNLGNKTSSLHSYGDQDASDLNLGAPQRPPSVSLPSIGQEGNEYADIEYEKPQEVATESNPSPNEPTQTRNVGSDLPLHAPRPSFSSSTAKARVSTVTRTDSTQAAAAGIGKAGTPVVNDDKNLQNPTLRSKVSFSRTESSASTELPVSAQANDSDHGIPEIGQRVPMHPDAGDVQAPSPSPFSPTFSPGAGLHSDGTPKHGRHHGRTRSGREVFRGPPGSYGMHGHGVPHTDPFGKAWYEKHPDALVREEHGQYGSGVGGRGEWALSSEDLNKIVRDTASKGSGIGTSPIHAGLPNEQIGYMASEEYTCRINTPSSVTYPGKAHSNHSQTHVESPLRKASFPVDVDGKDAFEKAKEPHGLTHTQSESALESETEDDEVLVKAPAIRKSKYAGNGYDPPTEDLGPHGGNTSSAGGWIDETGYGVPILASDEVAKEPGIEHLQPAVSPVQERRGSNYYTGVDSDVPPSYQSGYRNSSRSGSATNSRPSSRPVSVHGSLPGLMKFISHDEREDLHTPLENVDEYEPLFPEEDKDAHPVAAIDKFKRRENIKRRFPSQDIWEDTPNSLQLQATVEIPESTEEQAATITKETSAVFESPETEAARKREVDEDEKAKLLPKEERLATSHFKPHLLDESQRMSMKQRFPSRDIWEDSPDHAQLETTIGDYEDDEIKSHSGKNPKDQGVQAGAGVYTSGGPDEGTMNVEQARDGATSGAATVEKPSIPPRPAKSKLAVDSSGPSVQSSPNVPARPAKRMHQVPTAENLSTLSKSAAELSPVESKPVSPSEPRKAPAVPDRPKPQVPARPSRAIAQENSDFTPFSKTSSAGLIASGDTPDDKRGITSPPAPKPKPLLPVRPVGGKIASLKAGFLSDLDKRLQLGPQAPKPSEKLSAEPEIVEEKARLGDARKGRAKGPARRKHAAPASTAAVAKDPTLEGAIAQRTWTIQQPWIVWKTNDDGSLDVVHASTTSPEEQTRDTPSLATRVSASASIELTKDSVAKDFNDIISIHNPSSVKSPEAVAAVETEEDFPASKETMSQDSSSSKEFTPPASTSPDLHDQTMVDAIIQTGEKAITVNPDADAEERLVAYLDGEAQGEEKNTVVRE